MKQIEELNKRLATLKKENMLLRSTNGSIKQCIKTVKEAAKPPADAKK